MTEDYPGFMLDKEIMNGSKRLILSEVAFSEKITKREFYIGLHGIHHDALMVEEDEKKEWMKNPSVTVWMFEGKFLECDPEKFKSECEIHLISMYKAFEKSCEEEFRKENRDEFDDFEMEWNRKRRKLEQEKYEFMEKMNLEMRKKYKEQLDAFSELAYKVKPSS